MRAPRNPFHVRFVEDMSDSMFLKWFSPGVLDVLPKEEIWNRVNVLRSAPGAGKSSLLRAFTPTVLLQLYAYKDQYKDLYGRMKDLGAINDDGPQMVGVVLSFAQNIYETLDYLDIDEAKRDRYLLSLLNARIVLSVLRASLDLKRCRYPDDVDKLYFNIPHGIHLPPKVPYEGSGRVYYEWARKLEETVCESIDGDGMDLPDTMAVAGHDSLFSLWMVDPQYMSWGGAAFTKQVSVMFDDVHKLTARQRRRLLSLLADLRAPTRVWVAERLAALTVDEIISEGSIERRDWNLIYLESYWQKNRKQFEAFARGVADKRAESASDGQISTFAGCLHNEPDAQHFQGQILSAVGVVAERVRGKVGLKPRYQDWLTSKEVLEGTASERLQGWRMLEILIERDLQRAQTTLDFDQLTTADLHTQDQSDVRSAAQLFLAKEFNSPYYFGFPKLAYLASSNIEQFLGISGTLFEELLSTSLLNLARKEPEISAEQQQRIIKRAISEKWEEVIRRVSRPTDVRSLLTSAGNFCRAETYRPSAPYAPGVTGIGIRMSDREKLRDVEYLRGNKDHARVAQTIATCLSQNMFEPALDYSAKNDRWMVLYLNRMFCVQFDLPLQYGGWRGKSLKELSLWIEKGFTPRGNGGLFD